MGPPRPRSRSPYPESIRPKLSRPDGSYSVTAPESRHDQAKNTLVDALEEARAESNELRRQRAEDRLESVELRRELADIRRNIEQRPKVDSVLPASRDGVRITISRGTTVAIVSVILSTGGLAVGVKAWSETANRAEKPVVQTHVRDLNSEMDAAAKRIKVLEDRQRSLSERMQARDCWWIGVLEKVAAPGAQVRMPKKAPNCQRVEVSSSIPRRGAPPVIEIQTEYPE